MSADAEDRWGLARFEDPPDWSDIKVQFDPDDPAKTIPLSWAQDYIQRAYRKNPARFGAALGDVVADWSAAKYAGDG